MGVVDRAETNLLALYDDDYYSASPEGNLGYVDYEFTAEHSTAWAAALVRLIAKPGSDVLDIGCADGHLLKKLVGDFGCFGIEVNEEMARRAEAAGVEIIARDLGEALVSAGSRRFDVVTAIAVLEHLDDFRFGVERALALLNPGGSLVLEVPLVGGTADDAIWFSSSLEHVAYPTEPALEHLFAHELQRPVTGGEVVIEDFGSTYVGLVGPEDTRERFGMVAEAPLEHLGLAERRFRFFFDVVHAGRTTATHARLLGELHAELNESSMRRVAEVWARSEERLEAREEELERAKASWEDTREYLRVVEEARDWHARRSRDLEQERDALLAEAAGAGSTTGDEQVDNGVSA
jgi:SAM-dependent methyltransferase